MTKAPGAGNTQGQGVRLAVLALILIFNPLQQVRQFAAEDFADGVDLIQTDAIDHLIIQIVDHVLVDAGFPGQSPLAPSLFA
jgi:hypothetical protein